MKNAVRWGQRFQQKLALALKVAATAIASAADEAEQSAAAAAAVAPDASDLADASDVFCVKDLLLPLRCNCEFVTNSLWLSPVRLHWFPIIL